ncbi:MAG: hypothetical protein S4CHLAM20_15170 [Chlamydiia bacterium]|nr:hypothetical protein [Chlamydiia bacterium]
MEHSATRPSGVTPADLNAALAQVGQEPKEAGRSETSSQSDNIVRVVIDSIDRLPSGKAGSKKIFDGRKNLSKPLPKRHIVSRGASVAAPSISRSSSSSSISSSVSSISNDSVSASLTIDRSTLSPEDLAILDAQDAEKSLKDQLLETQNKVNDLRAKVQGARLTTEQAAKAKADALLKASEARLQLEEDRDEAFSAVSSLVTAAEADAKLADKKAFRAAVEANQVKMGAALDKANKLRLEQTPGTQEHFNVLSARFNALSTSKKAGFVRGLDLALMEASKTYESPIPVGASNKEVMNLYPKMLADLSTGLNDFGTKDETETVLQRLVGETLRLEVPADLIDPAIKKLGVDVLSKEDLEGEAVLDNAVAIKQNKDNTFKAAADQAKQSLGHLGSVSRLKALADAENQENKRSDNLKNRLVASENTAATIIQSALRSHNARTDKLLLEGLEMERDVTKPHIDALIKAKADAKAEAREVQIELNTLNGRRKAATKINNLARKVMAKRIDKKHAELRNRAGFLNYSKTSVKVGVIVASILLFPLFIGVVIADALAKAGVSRQDAKDALEKEKVAADTSKTIMERLEAIQAQNERIRGHMSLLNSGLLEDADDGLDAAISNGAFAGLGRKTAQDMYDML